MRRRTISAGVAVSTGVLMFGLVLPVQAATETSSAPDVLPATVVATTSEDKDGFRVTTFQFSDGTTAESGVEIGIPATPEQLQRMIENAAEFVPDEFDGLSSAPERTTDTASRAAGVDQCIYGTGASVKYAENCRVYYDGITWSSSFRADYQQWKNSSAAQYNLGTRNTVSFVGTVSDELVLNVSAGRIRYQFNYHPAAIGTVPFWLDLVVTPNEAYAVTGP